MYIEGSFSKTVSNLTVSAGLPVDLPQKTTLVGVGTVASNDTTAVSKQDSGSVEVFAYQNYTTGDTEIRVQYINEGCYVGANPDPVIAGCKSCQCLLLNITIHCLTLLVSFLVSASRPR